MSRRTAALGEGLNDGWHVIIFIREPNDGQVATEAQIARQVRQVGDLRVHHKRSCHLDAREVDTVTPVVDAIAHPLVRLEIGRASCRERVCQYVYISLVAVSLKKKKI